MIIKVLTENTSINEQVGCEHGLSLYIETEKHKLLFDTGSTGLFAKNALKMDVDLGAVDIAFISHGHHDHGGGLENFLQRNNRAKVHICQEAFIKHFANYQNGGPKFFGIDEALLKYNRFVFTEQKAQVDEELETFSGVSCRRLNPAGNADLLMQDGDSLKQDDFKHEQNLVVRSLGKTVLISGCSHCGIVNILEHFHKDNGCYPDVVIGGFHLQNPVRNQNEKPETVREIGDFLLETNAKFYTCHCTGLDSYTILKDVMGDAVDYLAGGRTLII